MFHHTSGRLFQRPDDLNGGIQIEQIVVGELFAMNHCSRTGGALTLGSIPVKSRLLLGIFSVSKIFNLGISHREAIREEPFSSLG